MTDAPRPDSYWCDADSEEFSRSYFARITNQTLPGSYGYLGTLQLRSHLHFYGALPTGFVGAMPSSAMANRSGEQGENVELRVNWLRAHANAKHQIIVAPKLAWGCQPINTDARSMADASRGSTILEALWKQGNYETLAISAVLGSILYGEEFLFTYWDANAGEQLAYDEENDKVSYKGDLVCHEVPAWNVFRDPMAINFEASPWRSARIPVNRWDLIALYPDFEEEILAAESPPASTMTNSQGNTISVSDADKVMCHYFFHRRTPAMPTGMQAVLVSEDCVLDMKPLERCYWDLPIHRVSAGDLKGTPYGYSDFWEAMSSQDLATDIQGSLATNIVTFGKQMISAESNQDLPVNQIGNGPRVIYRPAGSAPPTPLQLTASPPEAFKHLDNLKADQRLALGLNDVAMGEAPTGTPNAQAWALLSTASITANSGGQRSWVNLVRSVGRSMLAIFKEKASYTRKTAVVGIHGASVPKQEEWDQSDFEGIDDVTVEIANPLSQTAAGRIQLAQMHMEAGFVLTPEQLTMVTETGSLQPMTQVLRDELIYIEWENEGLMQGADLPVMITDSHQMHIREHKSVTFSGEARSTPEIIQAANAHIQKHIQLAMTTDPAVLAMLGQAAPQQQQGPPPGPPGAPSGGPPMKTPMDSPATAGPQGQAAAIKLPTAPTSPATGAQAAPPGMPQ